MCREARLPGGTSRRSARRRRWTIILDGVRSGSWRILAGEDAKTIEVCDRCGKFVGAETSQGV